jgi:hypothetical protein
MAAVDASARLLPTIASPSPSSSCDAEGVGPRLHLVTAAASALLPVRALCLARNREEPGENSTVLLISATKCAATASAP